MHLNSYKIIPESIENEMENHTNFLVSYMKISLIKIDLKQRIINKYYASVAIFSQWFFFHYFSQKYNFKNRSLYIIDITMWSMSYVW